jgi:hypothetical protein
VAWGKRVFAPGWICLRDTPIIGSKREWTKERKVIITNSRGLVADNATGKE